MGSVSPPLDFEEAALAQFDDLLEKGELIYQPTKGEIVGEEGDFQLEFRISPSIAKKTVLAPDAPERRGHGGPFINPDPQFVVPGVELGPDHVLEFSKHAMFRPHYVLHTRLFAPQTDDLDLGDLSSAWAVMRAARGPQVMIYNCGYDAGASQGHKHMQVFAEPTAFPLFPSYASSTEEILSGHPTVPYKHFVLRLPDDAAPEQLLQTYLRLLHEVRRVQAEHGGPRDYNVVMTARWMCLIPRRRGGRDGTGAGSLGMLGLLWLRGQDERDHWDALGHREHLAWMGYPRD